MEALLETDHSRQWMVAVSSIVQKLRFESSGTWKLVHAFARYSCPVAQRLAIFLLRTVDARSESGSRQYDVLVTTRAQSRVLGNKPFNEP
jgi:hypothetical protein